MAATRRNKTTKHFITNRTFIMPSFKNLILLLSIIAASVFVSAKETDTAPGALAAVYRIYDTLPDGTYVGQDEKDEDDDDDDDDDDDGVVSKKITDCQPKYVNEHICPKDLDLPCSPIEKIEEFCTTILGAHIAAVSKASKTGIGENGLAGCTKYVGYHLADGHFGCCPSSNECKEWVKTTYDLEEVDDDDDDDEEDEDAKEEL